MSTPPRNRGLSGEASRGCFKNSLEFLWSLQLGIWNFPWNVLPAGEPFVPVSGRKRKFRCHFHLAAASFIPRPGLPVRKRTDLLDGGLAA